MRKLRKKFTQSLMALAATGLLLTAVSAAHAAEKITYRLPAPAFLPAFSPWMLAKHLGYYDEEGL